MSLDRAFDELRFGPERTLNLRAALPSATEAAERAEKWLRERQVAGADEVLVITGRGRSSQEGVSPVREAIIRLLTSLRRRNVVASVQEHTAGSFVVRLAPVAALFEAPRRRREHGAPPVADPAALEGLAPDTRRLLRDLAHHALAHLGVRDPSAAIVRSEMERQFARLLLGIPDGPGREERLRDVIRRAIEEHGA